MTDQTSRNAGDKTWSRDIAELAADSLLRAKLIAPDAVNSVTEIIASDIYLRLVMEDRPDSVNK